MEAGLDFNGYAYVDNTGHVAVETVHLTELGAKVNAIVIGSQRTVVPLNHHTDQEIEIMFRRVTKYNGRIAKVKVAVADA